jgi:MoaA/NifB/PqqE/SkfB family radical SAM enzyme
MIKLISEIPQYNAFRRFGFPKKMPFSLTINITNRCNCRCKICGIFKNQLEELSLEEIKKIFHSFKTKVYWLTFSGGEPFLREDFDKICIEAHNILKPRVITIPTNGTLSEIITEKMKIILDNCSKTHLIVNLSIDAIGEKHDKIRNFNGCFNKVISTYNSLSIMRNKNFSLGIHTALSKYNTGNFPGILSMIMKMGPDSYIIEYAQKRVELNNLDGDFSAQVKDYIKCIEELRRIQCKIKTNWMTKVIKVMRNQYYGLTESILLGAKQILPCFAGFSCAHISSDGEVWACGIKSESMGSLKSENYDFKKVWFGSRAQAIRKQAKMNKCYCVNANINYQNMFFNTPYLFKFCLGFLKIR